MTAGRQGEDQGATAAHRGQGALAALANRNYRLFMAGQVISQSGSWMQRIAQSWIVLQLTDSAAALGTVVTIQFLPILALSLFAGALADRVPKRRALVGIQVVNIAQAATLATLVATNQIALWQIYALAAVQGTANALEQPLRQAFPSELVGRELIPNAIALNSTVQNTARVLGPALGGFVVTWISLAGAFALNAASYVAVLVALALIRHELPHPQPAAGLRSPIREIGEALAFAGRRPPIVFTLCALSCLGIFGFNYSTFMPLLARYRLGLGAGGYGTLSVALGAGAIVGAVAIARVGYTSPLRQAWGGIGFAVFLAGVGWSSWAGLSLGLIAALGLAGTVFTTTANTTLQLSVPDGMRGRIMGLYTLLLAGMTPPGALVTGLLADRWDVGTALQIEAAVCLVGVVVGLGYFLRARRAGAVPSAAAGVA
ncbi:MAG TPA: MFS transporter [Chloroflexota bacterium]|nr:MFS transporter [Chloroflexota bacterium]